MANLVTGDIIAKTHSGLVPKSSTSDKDRLRDQAIGEWIQVTAYDTANATVNVIAAYLPYAATIKSIYVCSANTIAADPAEYKTYTVSLGTAGVLRTAATGNTQAASLNGLTANVPKAMTLSTTQANLEAAAGDIIHIALTDSAGTTSTLGSGLFFIYVERKYE